MFAFIYWLTSILAEISYSNYVSIKKNSMINKLRVLKSSISSQTWNCDVLVCKKPCGMSLTSGAWSSRTNVNLKPQTWQQANSHLIFFTFGVCGKWLKTSILRWPELIYVQFFESHYAAEIIKNGWPLRKCYLFSCRCKNVWDIGIC